MKDIHTKTLAIAGCALIVLAAFSACTSGDRASSKGELTGGKGDLLQRGDALVQQQRYTDAVAAYRGAVDINPNDGRAYLKLAKTYMLLQEWSDAASASFRAAELLPADPEAQQLATEQMLSKGRWEDVIDRADAVLKKKPEDPQALVNWGNATAHLLNSTWALYKLPDTMGTVNDFERARLVLRADTTDAEDARAEAAFRHALRVAPTMVDAQLALVNLFWAQGHPEKGEELLRAVAVALPGHAAANYALGAYLLSAKRGPEAEPFLKNAVASGQRQAQFALVDYYSSAGRDDEALKVLDAMGTGDDESGDVSLRAAKLEVRQARYTHAINRLDRLLVRHPENAQALAAKSAALLKSRNPDAALAAARAAVTADPFSFETHAVLGEVLRARGMMDEATAEFTEALDRNPAHVVAAAGLAAIYADRKRKLQEALGLALTAQRQDPGNPAVRDVLGWVYVRLNRASLGIADLKAAVAAAPDNPLFRYHLGMAYLGLVKSREAREELSRALALDGAFSQAEDVRKALASIKP